MIIDGKKIITRRTFSIQNPFTGKRVGAASDASERHIDEALRLSYETKPRLNARERATILLNISKKLKSAKKMLARIITDESGLSIKDTMHEIDRVISCARYASKVAMAIEKDTTPDYLFNGAIKKPRLRVLTDPLDLVVAITPFNHPMNQVAHKVFPAIAAGACVVLKPSEKTPLSAVLLGEILLKSGLQKNMLNVITGIQAQKIVKKMVTNTLVDMVTFTGGLQAGLYIARAMTNSENALKKYVPELGGCSSLIINKDADLVLASKIAVKGCFGNSGQRCTAIRRIIAVKGIADKFVELLIKNTERLKYGNPYDETVDVGTVISKDAARSIEKRVNKAIKDGAKLLLGNRRLGALYSPTVLDHVNIESELVMEETFGPVAPIIRVKDLSEAIRMADMTQYALAGAIITKDKKAAELVQERLKVGQFSWNGIPGYRTEAAPFGGFRNSGNSEKEGVVLAARGMRRIRTVYEH